MEPITTTPTTFANGLEAAWFATLAFLPKLVAFLVVLIIGYFIALAIGKVFTGILEKVGFNRAVERSGIRKALASSGYHPSVLLGQLAFYTIFLFVLQMAFAVFGPNPVSDVLTRVIAFLPNVFVAVIIVVVAASIAKAVRDIIRGALGGLSYGSLLADIASVSILVIGAFAALNQLQIAPAIVQGLYFAILAIVVGVSVVAIGGAGIVPMRARWEQALTSLEREVPRAAEHVRSQTPAVEPNAATRPNEPYVI